MTNPTTRRGRKVYSREKEKNNKEKMSFNRERQFWSVTRSRYHPAIVVDGNDDPISAEILLLNRHGRHDGSSEASHLGIQNFIVDAIFTETLHIGATTAARWDAGGHSNSHISLRGLLLRSWYTPQVLTFESATFFFLFFIVYLKRAARVIGSLDINLKLRSFT